MSYNEKTLFWDYNNVESEKTTAGLIMHKPVKREMVMLHDEPWEGDACGYYNIIEDDGIYRMYYLARKSDGAIKGIIIPGLVCYAESRDGLRWTKPALKIYQYNGIWENNIILDDNADLLDNFFVMKDTNPQTPDSERYKGVAVSYLGAKTGTDVSLWCYTSADGINFKKAWVMSDEGTFDSLNTVVWNEEKKLYYCFYRGMHKAEDGTDFRDICIMTSPDFKNWKNYGRIEFDSSREYQMYTNGVFQYPDNKNYLIGLATRYVERREWTENYDELCGREKRLLMMERSEPRSGLALTDCMLMTSSDGFKWHRFDEAFLTPGIEKKENWIYGDCYPCVGMIETASDEEYAPPEFSLYMKEGHRSCKPARLYRYTIRRDGFASMHSPVEESRIITKPFEYDGGELLINFSTSAAGYVYINILDEDGAVINGFSSCELFGNSCLRRVRFGSRLDELKGKSIRLEIIMSDADIYSFVFK